ncbi:MAG: hypothetical protein J5I90_08380 [Caldilineales bacterium]|nr:hypothetical protein [Caldilineales bacterium]
MKIERIYVASHRGDLRYTRCCIASVRRWYPDIPISLVKNEINGVYDTSEIERYWDVDCFQMPRRRFSGGLAKLEPLVQDRVERCFILDSDTVFLGRVLDRLESIESDFVINESDTPENVAAFFFDLDRLKSLDPEFAYRGNAFNSGQYVTSTGLINRQDFSPWLSDGEPQELLYPDVFFASDQGLLNYVVLKKWQNGQLALAGRSFMWWAGDPHLVIKPELMTGEGVPIVLHWAGSKTHLFRHMPQPHVLDFYERLYYSRIPAGRVRRLQSLVGNAVGLEFHRLRRRSKHDLSIGRRQARELMRHFG